jgi:hypothetical protein
MTTERDPLADRSGGLLLDKLRALDDADLGQVVNYWEARTIEHEERGDGFGAWWCTKFTSAARTEQRRRIGSSPD